MISKLSVTSQNNCKRCQSSNLKYAIRIPDGSLHTFCDQYEFIIRYFMKRESDLSHLIAYCHAANSGAYYKAGSCCPTVYLSSHLVSRLGCNTLDIRFQCSHLHNYFKNVKIYTHIYTYQCIQQNFNSKK